MSFSRKLMRTLSHMCRMRDELSVTITDARTTLRHVCANSDEQDLYNRISHLIHTLNSDWFQYLKLIKENKLQRLTANSPEQTTHQEPNIEDNDTLEVDKVVKTIPENLNLSEAEKSILKKGLNFIPIKPKRTSLHPKMIVRNFTEDYV